MFRAVLAVLVEASRRDDVRSPRGVAEAVGLRVFPLVYPGVRPVRVGDVVVCNTQRRRAWLDAFLAREIARTVLSRLRIEPTAFAMREARRAVSVTCASEVVARRGRRRVAR